jgi:hypothetical protein
MSPDQAVEDCHLMPPVGQIQGRCPTTIAVATNNKDFHVLRIFELLLILLPNLSGFGPP